MAHAAESLHWYTREGGTAYTVPSKDGSPRPTTLRDARKLNLVPSVTNIIKCAAAPGLEIWKQKQVLLAALTLPRIDGEPEAAYLERVMVDSREQAKNAAERGSVLHAALQGFYEGEGVKPEHRESVLGALRELDQFGSQAWKAERSFACQLGFGGKVDLSSNNVVIDFKTKEFDTTADLKTWDEHAMQLAAYREGLGLPLARCGIVYVSTTSPGLSKLIEIPEEELQQGWTMFYSLLHYWQAKNKYKSSFERLAA